MPIIADFRVVLDALGILYTYTGRYSEAEPLLKQALAVRTENLLPDCERSPHRFGSMMVDRAHLDEIFELPKATLDLR